MIRRTKLILPGEISVEVYVEHPDQITFKKVLEVIAKEDPFIVGDYHLLKDKLIVEDDKKQKKEETRSERVIRLHNARVKKDDWVLFLGDLSESELREGSDILELQETFNRLNGKQIIVLGNNDSQRWDFYVDLGYKFVTRSPIAVDNYVFSHEPIDIVEINPDKKDLINFHGHIHDHNIYFNMKSERHINCYWETFDGPLRLSKWLNLYENKKLPRVRTQYN
jgi:calcineurin-like phosphoesterase family protein